MKILLSLLLSATIGFTATAMQGMEKKPKPDEKTLKERGDQLLKDANGLQADDYKKTLRFHSDMSSYLEDGGNINHQDKDGYTALMASIHKTAAINIDLVEYLLQMGTNVNHQDKHGQTALMVATFKANPLETIQLLIKAGANVNIANKAGRTVLHLVADGSDPEVLEELIKAGANLELKDNDNHTALYDASVRVDLSRIDSPQFEESMKKCEILVEAILKRMPREINIKTLMLCIKRMTQDSQDTWKYNAFRQIFKKHFSQKMREHAKQYVIDNVLCEEIKNMLLKKYFPEPISAKKESSSEEEEPISEEK